MASSCATRSGARPRRSRCRRKGRVALCYHNITPGELLRDFNPEVADLCDRGRAALSTFRGRVEALIADSGFNAADLRGAGLGEPAVVPLLLPLPAEVPRRDPNREPVVLTVGRIVPNKRLEDVVKAFTLYQRHRAPEASLVVVGSDVGFENYRHELDVLVARIGARRVLFTGSISSEARDAWYSRADVYLSMSAHEGFCAPVVESLAHGVPVVARGAGAVPETLGGAGLLLDGADLPLVAEALHELASSRSTRSALFDAADARLAELRPGVLAPRVKAALAPLLGLGRARAGQGPRRAARRRRRPSSRPARRTTTAGSQPSSSRAFDGVADQVVDLGRAQEAPGRSRRALRSRARRARTRARRTPARSASRPWRRRSRRARRCWSISHIALDVVAGEAPVALRLRGCRAAARRRARA